MTRPRLVPRPPDDPRHTPVLLRKELIAGGLDDGDIARMRVAGVIERIRRGAYVDGPSARMLDDVGRYGLITRAVLKQAKTAVVASHVSAVAEYEGPMWSLDLSTTHVTRTDGKAGRCEAGVQQHCGALIDGDVTRRNGIPVTSATRAALELTTVAGTEACLGFVNHLLHHGETTQEELAQRYRLMEHWPYTLKTDVVLRLANPLVESLGETRTLYLCFRHAIPMPQLQYAVRDGRGTIVARVDFAWPELGVFLEFDGRIKYEKLLQPGERASDVVLKEKRREELICRLTGWRCVRITWADLERPEYTASLIRSALAGQAA